MAAIIEEFTRSPIATLASLISIVSLVIALALTRPTSKHLKAAHDPGHSSVKDNTASIPTLLAKSLLLLSIMLGFGLLGSIFLQTKLPLLIFLFPVVIIVSTVLISYLAGNFLTSFGGPLYLEARDKSGLAMFSDAPRKRWIIFTNRTAMVIATAHWIVFMFCCSGAYASFLEMAGGSWTPDISVSGLTMMMGLLFIYLFWGAFTVFILYPISKLIIPHQIAAHSPQKVKQ